ncbi:serine hydrolase domain-containing protein [Marinobacter sp. SS21]|uniref:serine hydrolase domain-containing protein n=1 Tax=Marinobacter sp. SS21 TaxID=2979460 RepID=UPI00232D5739|nr:serine hydrolase [Marinobacter sp. SS21]MDC0662774.1 serine hydrolase [Marinobacter sp. SS21]
MKRLLTYLIPGLLALSVVAAALNAPTLQRLYHTVTLFDDDVIVSNFSNMDEIFETVAMPASGPASTFGENPQPLPARFSHGGEIRDTKHFLETTNTTALLVVKDGKVTFEEYFLGTQPEDRRISWSVAKSFLSALFGIAVAEGDIASLDTPVSDYVPSLNNTGYDGVAIKDVLQMSSGVRFDEDYARFNSDINRFGRLMALGGSLDEFATTLEREREPGTYLHYVSIDTHVLGMVLRAATGRELAEYFNDKLWSRLGSEDSTLYLVDSFNEPMVLGGLNMRTRDFARFGSLYLNQGYWNGQQIVPAQWVTDSVTPDAPHLVPGERDSADLTLGYGYQWWIPENADQEFMAIGIYDQFIYVNQKLGMVIVKNSANTRFTEDNFESMRTTVSMFRAIAASLTSGGYPEQPAVGVR